MGIETEYGVLQQGNPMANPMLMSSQVVTAYRAISSSARSRARWDYDDEDPLLDARGFHVRRASAHPSLLTDDPSRPAPAGPVAGEPQVQSIDRPAVEAYVRSSIGELNGRLNRWETIKDFRILDHDLSVENDELTPSMKVRRKTMEATYGSLLDSMYDGQSRG